MVRLQLARLGRPLFVLAGVAAIVLLLAWLMGAFHDRLPPGPALPQKSRPAVGERLRVELVRVPRHETAVGTIRAIQETVVASRVLGRIEMLTIERAGQPVQKDELLVRLEDSDLRALANQARAALAVATTRRDKAKLDFDRTETLVRQGVSSVVELDGDRALLAAAEAEVERAEQGVAAADVALGYAMIRAPIGGIVVDKQVQQGDILQPGQPVCTLYDPTRLQLVAVVREELAGRLKVGQDVDVTLDALGRQCHGRVTEIVPAALTASRSFEVKVTGPCQPGVVTGMFGRLAVPLGDVEELRVPVRAVERQGQLDFVHVVADERAVRRLVRTGRTTGDQVEILSGLAAGETVLLPGEGR